MNQASPRKFKVKQFAKLRTINRAVREGDLNKARTLIEDLGGDGNDSELAKFYFLGKTSMRERKYDEAISWFDKALKLNPSFQAAILQKGKVLEAKRDVPSATEAFRAVLDLNPDKEQALLKLGKLSLAKGEFDDAESTISHAISLNPQNLKARLMLASIHEKRGDIDKARNALKEIITDYPNSAYANQRMGTLLLRIGQLSDAKGFFEKATALDSARALPTFLLGNIHYKLNELNSAEKVFHDCLEKHPQFKPALYRLAEVIAALGSPNDAIKLLQQDIIKRRKRSSAHAALGKIYTAQGRYEMALQEFQAHLHHHPQLAESRPEILELLKGPASDVSDAKKNAEEISTFFEEEVLKIKDNDLEPSSHPNKRRKFLGAIKQHRQQGKLKKRFRQ